MLGCEHIQLLIQKFDCSIQIRMDCKYGIQIKSFSADKGSRRDGNLLYYFPKKKVAWITFSFIAFIGNQLDLDVFTYSQTDLL